MFTCYTGRAAGLAGGPDPGPRRAAGRRRVCAPLPRARLARARLGRVLPHLARAPWRSWPCPHARRRAPGAGQPRRGPECGRLGNRGGGRGRVRVCRAAGALRAAAAGQQGQHGAAAGAGGRLRGSLMVRLAARAGAVGAGRGHGRHHRRVLRGIRARIPERHAAEVRGVGARGQGAGCAPSHHCPGLRGLRARVSEWHAAEVRRGGATGWGLAGVGSGRGHGRHHCRALRGKRARVCEWHAAWIQYVGEYGDYLAQGIALQTIIRNSTAVACLVRE